MENRPIIVTSYLLGKNGFQFNASYGWYLSHPIFKVYICIDMNRNGTISLVDHHWQREMQLATKKTYVHELEPLLQGIMDRPVLVNTVEPEVQHGGYYDHLK